MLNRFRAKYESIMTILVREIFGKANSRIHCLPSTKKVRPFKSNTTAYKNTRQ